MIPERLIAMLSGFFGALGALLAAIGLYGLLAYTVARRTSEIGIRMALGATQRDVTRMVQKSALALVGAGLVLGVPLAFAPRASRGDLRRQSAGRRRAADRGRRRRDDRRRARSPRTCRRAEPRASPDRALRQD